MKDWEYEGYVTTKHVGLDCIFAAFIQTHVYEARQAIKPPITFSSSLDECNLYNSRTRT